MKRDTMILLTLVVLGLFLVSACDILAGLMELSCMINPDSDHCYQATAIQTGDPDECAKIKGEKFKDMGSNPPRDKCYLEIAANTGDLSVCDNIKGGPMSYTRSECILGSSIKNENPSGCKLLSGADAQTCRSTLSSKIDAFKVLEVDRQIETVQDALKKGSDPELEKQLRGLQQKQKDMVDVLSQKEKDTYVEISDKTYQKIIDDSLSGTIDDKTKTELIALAKDLRTKGQTLSAEDYNAIRDYRAFVNDPKNNIENMDPKDILKQSMGDRVGGAWSSVSSIWRGKDTPEEKAEDVQLRFYQKMLEKQAVIGNEAQGLSGSTKLGILNFFTNMQVKSQTGMGITTAAGASATVTTLVAGEAINSVKDWAQKSEMRGLVHAYNAGMAETLGAVGGDVNKAHAIVTQKLEQDPYAYTDPTAAGGDFVKYGNLLQGGCSSDNPHCVQHDVFWKAMKKSYTYQHS